MTLTRSRTGVRYETRHPARATRAGRLAAGRDAGTRRRYRDYGVKLVDWERYLANPYIELTVRRPAGGPFPVTIDLKAEGTSRLIRWWAGMRDYVNTQGANDQEVIAYQGRAVPLDSSYHIPGTQQYWDRLSGQSGGWNHLFPTRRWMATKLALLVAENAGWTLNRDPTSSNSGAPNQGNRWGTWPEQGEQWAELRWTSAQAVRQAQVYFFDDNQGIDLPASWRLQYWTGSSYVDIPGTYPVAGNQFNIVNFAPVSTDRLRVVLRSAPDLSVGLLEVKVSG